ncbi:MAG: hypothetical protein OES09_10585 [Gammaproteobacteria bacterium]|nr:hypothetical protein [Gammaproteobacteria bacterium]
MPRRNRARLPPKANSSHLDHLRVAVCEEAARIMADECIRDFQVAKQKARERLGLSRRRVPLPSNKEIDQALGNRLRLFAAPAFEEALLRLRCAARDAMHLLKHFEPRLAGALVRENVTRETPVEIHLFPDTPEDVADYLHERSIRYESFEKRVRYPRDRSRGIPGFRYAVEDIVVEALTFARKDMGEAPLCPVDGKPMQRISLKAVEGWFADPKADHD